MSKSAIYACLSPHMHMRAVSLSIVPSDFILVQNFAVTGIMGSSGPGSSFLKQVFSLINILIFVAWILSMVVGC